jgi:hypothetical protein
MSKLIEDGYATRCSPATPSTHDLEASLFHTGLGQDIYTKELVYNGHYHHLERSTPYPGRVDRQAGRSVQD